MENQIITQRGFGIEHHILEMLLAVQGEHISAGVRLGDRLWASNSCLILVPVESVDWDGLVGDVGMKKPFSKTTPAYANSMGRTLNFTWGKARSTLPAQAARSSIPLRR